MRRLALCGALALATTAGCDVGLRISGTALDREGRLVRVEEPPPMPSASAVAVDPLGPKPELGAPRAFEPPAPQVFQVATGLTVWLVERPALPLVSMSLVVPVGAASDAPQKPGTMQLAVDMMDEGAGKRGAVELSDAVSALGASLGTGASHDGSFVQLTTHRRTFEPAFELFADVIARPRFEAADFKRAHRLWKAALEKRADDPAQVASVVTAAVAYGDSPYGRPSGGLASRADAVRLDDVKRAYQGAFRPDRATLVVVGKVTRAEIEAAVQKHLGAWKAVGEPLAAAPSTVRAERPKLVFVERPKAVQSVITVVRDGVEARDERAVSLDLVNTALGGSFTSRLNQNLREEKGWTYGVRSGFASMRSGGTFVVRTSVEAKHTGPAVREILGELGKMAEGGLTDEEVRKVKAQDRSDVVQTYETVAGTSSRLASMVSAGLPPAFDASAARVREGATQEDLGRLARAHVHPGAVSIVIVGDAATVLPQLAEAGLGEPVRYTAEGAPADAAPKKVAAPAPKPTAPTKR